MRRRWRRWERRAAPPGLVPLLRDLAWLAVGLGLLAPLAQGLLQRLHPIVGAPALIARLQAAERRDGSGAAGPVLHLLPEAADDPATSAPVGPDHRGRPAALRTAAPRPDGSPDVARGRSAGP